jgi:hypothetical protein
MDKMKDFSLTNKNGYLNIESRKDGGIGIYVECPALTLALTKDEMLKVIEWLIALRRGSRFGSIRSRRLECDIVLF